MAVLALIAGLLLAPVETLLAPDTLLANGGTLRLANVPMGDYRVSVFTDPTPVRPDTLDVSVLVLQEGVEGVAEGVEVWVRARTIGHGAQEPGHVPQELEWRATREQADDPRYYAAKFGLGQEGVWEIEVEVRGSAGAGSASFQVTARERGILGHPVVMVLLALLPLAGAAFWILRANGDEARAGSPSRSPPPTQSGA